MMDPRVSAFCATVIGLLPRVLIGVMLGLFARVLFAPASQANHTFPFSDPHQHLLSMTNYDLEQYCVDVWPDVPQPTDAEVYQMVRGTLHIDEPALLCVDSMFRWFPLRKVITEVYDFAGPLLHMVQVMGFEETGYLPDHYWHEDRSWGLHAMVLTRERWQQRREDFLAIVGVQRQYEELTRIGSDGGSET